MTPFKAAIEQMPLGFGCSGPLGAWWFSEHKLAKLIEAALQGGVRYFDTAGFYGRAQERLGRALVSTGMIDAAELFISTKTGTQINSKGEKIKDFSVQAINEDVARAQQALGRARIDILYLHGPAIADIERAREALQRLKATNQVAAIGYCGSDPTVAHAVMDPLFDVIMAPYNLLFRHFEAPLRQASQAGKTVIAITPLAQGTAGRGIFWPRSLTDCWYLARAFVHRRGTAEPSSAIHQMLAGTGESPTTTLLRYVLSRPFIDVALSTSSRPVNVAQLASIAQAEISPKQCTVLDALGDQIAATSS